MPAPPHRRWPNNVGTVRISDVAITDVATGGDGIGHAPDGRIVFVDGAVIGDVVDIAVTRERRSMLDGVVADVTTASPDRVEPPCPHVARGCGGCGWQHVSVDGQRRAKVRLVQESMRRLGRVDAPVTLGPDLPTDGFRTTMRMVATPDGVGFRAARSHDIVPVDSCLVAHPRLAELISRPDLWRDLQPGTEITLRVAAHSGERAVSVHGPTPRGWTLPDTAVWSTASSEPPPVLVEHAAGRDLFTSLTSFFQTRSDGAVALVEVVRRLGGEAWGSGHLVDLYGGVGLFAATLGDGMTTTLVESAASSVADARTNLDGHVVRSRTERWRPESRDRNPTVVVADPPRAGLHRDVVTTLVDFGPEVLVTVHCDAASHGRDVGRLVAAGFDVDEVVLVDLFPHTPHVELVSRLTPTETLSAASRLV